ncbi:hypothetical protein BWI96_16395 [Siphonobacter sp. SORGH_AS_0500]|nr:hypothetical protein BWI96_16395 [Siphonobacter sp. SORGH_AS_0500]
MPADKEKTPLKRAEFFNLPTINYSDKIVYIAKSRSSISLLRVINSEKPFPDARFDDLWTKKSSEKSAFNLE